VTDPDTTRSVPGFWRRRSGRITIAAAVVLALFVVASFTAARFTENNRFCGTDCHEMWPYRDTWQASAHKRVDCVRCHIPPGPINFIETKLAALREVYVHFTGQVKAPIKVTRHIPNSVCQSCHPASQTGKTIQLLNASFNHGTHLKGTQCIQCHDQLVHEPLPGVAYIPPQSMTKCFTCHDGKQQPNDCAYCHTAPHADRGPCQKCHNMQSWVPGAFKHPVPLVGTHAQILCEQCHTQASGTSMGFAAGCITCHGNHHNDPKLTLCAQCHTTAHFVPSTFKHPQEGEHIPTGEVPLQCNQCHTVNFSTASCPCHGGSPPSGGG
jgi:nitrate/TMAO reductase-like tetraheme cytochrome c subunit